MLLLINPEREISDQWVRLEDDQPVPVSGLFVVSLLRLAEVQSSDSHVVLAVSISGADDIQAVLPSIDRLDLIIIDIPVFTDGRGFSLARLLRRVGFTGEIRAEGDVTRDRLAFFKRCGFDSVDIPKERCVEGIEKALTEISVHYQGAEDDPNPIYRQKHRQKNNL